LKLNNRPNVKTRYYVSEKKGPSGFLVKFKTSEGLETFPKKCLFFRGGGRGWIL
jgi:hypothetical protein